MKAAGATGSQDWIHKYQPAYADFLEHEFTKEQRAACVALLEKRLREGIPLADRQK